jgi:ATP-dependent Clp protease ATP-binding subunit ClpX
MFEMSGSELEFTDEALHEIARKALARNTGARALRGVIEDVMLDIMYEIPSKREVSECVVNEEAIHKKEKPLIVYHKKAESA